MELTAQKREIFGKKVSVLRKQGIIPAELYGHGIKNLHLNIPLKEFSRVFKEAGESTILKLKIAGEKDFNVLVHDIERNALTDEISHIDFYSVKMDEKLKTKVSLEFTGESSAVKELDGILVKAMHEIEIEALPADLPHHIPVDLSKIKEIGGSIFVKDLNFGKGVKVLVDQETVIATVIEQKVEEEVTPVVSVEDVKVESEEKKEAREKAKEEEKTEK